MSKRVKADFQAWPEVEFMVRRVTEARERANLTQAEAAKLLGTAQSYVAELETGHVNPSYQLLAQLARAYRVPLASLAPSETILLPPNAPRRRTPDAG